MLSFRREALLLGNVQQPRPPRLQIAFAGLLIDARRTVGHERLQRLDRQIFEHEALHRPQDLLDASIDAVWREPLLRAARRQTQDPALVGKEARIIAPPIRVGEAVRKNAIEPSLEDRRHAAPPDRIDPDHEIGPEKALLLSGNLRREAVGRMRMALLDLIVEPVWIECLDEVVPARHRIETFRVEIGDFDAVAGAA